ncbi:UNVERIFIED_CONTAM: hypothetical protein K2H54_020022 [Gekko kuhli]
MVLKDSPEKSAWRLLVWYVQLFLPNLPVLLIRTHINPPPSVALFCGRALAPLPWSYLAKFCTVGHLAAMMLKPVSISRCQYFFPALSSGKARSFEGKHCTGECIYNRSRCLSSLFSEWQITWNWVLSESYKLLVFLQAVSPSPPLFRFPENPSAPSRAPSLVSNFCFAFNHHHFMNVYLKTIGISTVQSTLLTVLYRRRKEMKWEIGSSLFLDEQPSV